MRPVCPVPSRMSLQNRNLQVSPTGKTSLTSPSGEAEVWRVWPSYSDPSLPVSLFPGHVEGAVGLPLHTHSLATHRFLCLCLISSFCAW